MSKELIKKPSVLKVPPLREKKPEKKSSNRVLLIILIILLLLLIGVIVAFFLIPRITENIKKNEEKIEESEEKKEEKDKVDTTESEGGTYEREGETPGEGVTDGGEPSGTEPECREGEDTTRGYYNCLCIDGHWDCKLMEGYCEYHGNIYVIGEPFPSIDGCNTCRCTDPEGGVTCTMRICP